MSKLLPKCPRCLAEAIVETQTVLNLDDDEAADETWVACTKCQFSTPPAGTRDEAVENWKYPNGTPNRMGFEETSSLDEVSEEENFKECLISVLQDISKSLKTIATKR